MGNQRADRPTPRAKYLQAPPHSLPAMPASLPPLPTGLPELDALLPGGGLARGAITELQAPRGLGLSTAFALSLCAAAQRASQRDGRGVPWCAFLDPTRSLHAAGVTAHGVDIDRLLVIRPQADLLGRAAMLAAASRAFSVLVVDTGGLPGARVSDSLGPWVALARRLTTAIEGANTLTVLLTHREMARPLPLPVSTSVELTQERPGRLMFRVMRHRYGLPSEWQTGALPLPLREPLPASVEAS